MITITSPAAEKLAAALTENPGQTAVELAALAGIGRSTAGKLLYAWEQEGYAHRYAPHAGSPAHWAKSTEAETEIADEPGQPAAVVATARDRADAALAADDQDGLTEALLEMGVPASDPVAELADYLRASDPATAAIRLGQLATMNTTDTDLAAAAAAATDLATDLDGAAPNEAVAAAEPSEKPGRLRPGGLRDAVAEWLADNPSTEITPSRLAKQLDRSAGAIANALEALVASGDAARTNDKPKTYMHLSGDAA